MNAAVAASPSSEPNTSRPATTNRATLQRVRRAARRWRSRRRSRASPGSAAARVMPCTAAPAVRHVRIPRTRARLQSRAPRRLRPRSFAGPPAGRRLHSGSAQPPRSRRPSRRACALRARRDGLRRQARADLGQARHDLSRERQGRLEPHHHGRGAAAARARRGRWPPTPARAPGRARRRRSGRCDRGAHPGRPPRSRGGRARHHVAGRQAQCRVHPQARRPGVRHARRAARGHRARGRCPGRAHEPRRGRAGARAQAPAAAPGHRRPSRRRGAAQRLRRRGLRHQHPAHHAAGAAAATRGRAPGGPTNGVATANATVLHRLDPDAYVATSTSGVTLARLRGQRRLRTLRAITAGRFFVVDAAAARADTTAYALLRSLAHSLHPTVIKQ